MLLPKQSLLEEKKVVAILRTHRHTPREKQFKNGHILEHAKFKITIQKEKTVDSLLSMSHSR